MRAHDDDRHRATLRGAKAEAGHDILFTACHVVPALVRAQDLHVEALKTEYQRNPIASTPARHG
jgi:hypothetical protein